MAQPALERAGLRAWPRSWSFLLLGCVLVIGSADAVLLELGKTYFSGGYNGVYIDQPFDVIGFFAASVVLDTGLVLGLWALLLPVLSRFRLDGPRRLALSGIIALAIPLTLDYAHYTLYHILGDMVAVALLWEVSGRSANEMLVQAIPHLHPLAFGLLTVFLGGGFTLWAASWLERRIPSQRTPWPLPPARLLWSSFLATVAVGGVLLLVTRSAAPRIHFGLEQKASSSILAGLIQRISDVDRDGFGLLARPTDPAPFDASIHPYALDLPGNGIDENGMAGDHPLTFRSVEAEPTEASPGSRRPHFLLIFLESFRGDLIGSRLGEREITPFLNELARTGASSSRAYVNVPTTSASRAQLYTGRLVPQRGQPTLVDDFQSRGYRVAHFSGQDDSWGGSEEMLGLDRVDVFYDARQDVARRTSRSSSPGSLQISWKLLNERVLAFLETHDASIPLFLYVNFTDTHFPYDHHEIDNLLRIRPIARRHMNVDQSDRIRETYANSAANIDQAVRRLVEAWDRHMKGRDRAILVTADHGQAIFDEGFLGHGQSLTAAQTRVPLILSGIGGDWPEPIGMSDIRDQLRRHLFREEDSSGGGDSGDERVRNATHARFTPQPERVVFQFLPRIDRPRVLGLRALEGGVFVDLISGRFSDRSGSWRALSRLNGDDRAAFELVIRSWEAVYLRAAKEGALTRTTVSRANGAGTARPKRSPASRSSLAFPPQR